MKKKLLFLLLVTYSFSIDGFDKLKWESSPEDFYKYYNNYNYYTSDNSYFTLIDPDIYFEGEKLQRVDLFYNNLKLVQWCICQSKSVPVIRSKSVPFIFQIIS